MVFEGELSRQVAKDHICQKYSVLAWKASAVPLLFQYKMMHDFFLKPQLKALDDINTTSVYKNTRYDAQRMKRVKQYIVLWSI